MGLAQRTLTFNSSGRHMSVSVTTEIKGVNSTTVQVPPDAMAALNAATTQPAPAGN